MTGIGITALLDNVASHALQLGVFDKVNTHEPKVAPNAGITAAIWVQGVRPARSGMASTSVVVDFVVRLQTTMVSEPQDMIDPNLVNALDALMAAYSADIDAGGLARNVDLLGQQGVPMAATAGYIQMGNQVYRVYDLTVPIILNDVFDQAP